MITIYVVSLIILLIPSTESIDNKKIKINRFIKWNKFINFE